MAMRIHVVGALGATETELRTALDSIGGEGNGSRCFRVGSSHDWVWANASVWKVGGSEIDKALSTLSVPALRATSSDAVLWMLTLTGAGKKPFHGVHHFTEVGAQPPEPQPDVEVQDEDFPDDELGEVAGINRFIPELEFLWDSEEEARLKQEYAEEDAATVEGLEDYVDYGVELPDNVIEEMRRHPHRAYHTAFMAHGPQIVAALDDFGFKFDPVAMLQLLTVGPLTELESDSDIGNMPRFLRTLGIDGVFREPSDVEEERPVDDPPTEEDEGQPLDWSKYPPGKLFEKVEPLLAQCVLTEIANGPVRVTHVALLHLLAHFCSEDPTTSVSIEFPSEADQPTGSWGDFSELEVKRYGQQFRFCFESPSHCWFHVEDRDDLETHELAEAIGAPSVGTRIELTFVVDGLAENCHRYAGIYTNQGLELERAYPAVTSAVLADALDLVDQVFEGTSIAFTSKDEENVVRQTYQRSQGEVPKIRNHKIMPEVGSRDDVVQTLLFERFQDRGPWDIAGARRLVEEGWEWFDQVVNPDDQDEEDDDGEAADTNESSEEVSKFTSMLQEMSQAVEKMNEAKVVPHAEEVVYEGRSGKFLRASMSDLKHLSQDQLAEHDAKMDALGFQSIGDFVGDADQRQEITRCYVGPQAVALHGQRNENNQFGWADVSNGAVMVDFSQGTVEFHTRFEDGTTLVTTSIDAANSNPEVGVYVRAYEEVAVERLWEKHLDGIRRFKDHRDTVPVDHSKFGQPAQFLANIDELYCRIMGLE